MYTRGRGGSTRGRCTKGVGIPGLGVWGGGICTRNRGMWICRGDSFTFLHCFLSTMLFFAKYDFFWLCKRTLALKRYDLTTYFYERQMIKRSTMMINHVQKLKTNLGRLLISLHGKTRQNSLNGPVNVMYNRTASPLTMRIWLYSIIKGMIEDMSGTPLLSLTL